MLQTNDISADEAMQCLIDGNQRFLRGESRLSGMSHQALADLSKQQHPYAAILGCSDSRVSPERIFDAELGELFVMRVAGNVLSTDVAGSMQYAGDHLLTPLMVVLGHEGCGAIQAALATMRQGARHRSRIQLLVDSIMPGIEGVDAGLPPAALLSQAVEMNVRHNLRTILESPEWRPREEAGRVKCVGAIYEIETGRVRFLDPPSGHGTCAHP